jgi:integrase/recombinase XerD
MTVEYLESLRREGRYSGTTMAIISNWLSRLERFAGDRDAVDLRTADLVAWRKELAWQPGPSGRLLSENTVNQAVLAVRGFYRWAVASGALATDPAVSLKVRAVRSEGRPKLTAADRRKILAYPSLDTATGIRNRAVLAVLLETGISRQACSLLDLADLQLDIGALMASGRKGAGIHTLSDGLCADLERYLKEARPLLLNVDQLALFINRKGGRLSVGSVQAMVRHTLLGCGLGTSLFSS